jgi:hypothetical protein
MSKTPISKIPYEEVDVEISREVRRIVRYFVAFAHDLLDLD